MIIYFSGTGNTRLCALRLGALLGESTHELTAEELRNPSQAQFIPGNNERRIIWAFPTYSWGLPPVVARLMSEARFPKELKSVTHFMLTTCGDDMAYADRQWRKILGRRGAICGGAFAVQMPNTYTLLKGFDTDPADVVSSKLAASRGRLAQIAEAIEKEEPSMLIRGKFPLVKSDIIYPWFKRFAMSPKPFHVTNGCIGCGICSRSCPMANIAMKDKHPKWGPDCALCLRCYHICPQHAVAYGNATEGKGQYICPEK